MNFRPEMVLAIRRGKCETRRVASANPRSPWYGGGCAYRTTKINERPAKTYAICPGRGKEAVGRLRLTQEPELSVVENITEAGARNEGFESRDAFLDYFLKLNRGVDLKTQVWRVPFAVVSWDEEKVLAMIAEMEATA